MGHPFDHLFKSELFADADIVISHARADLLASTSSNELTRIPAHRAIVCSCSEYFKVKAERWQASNTQDSSSGASGSRRKKKRAAQPPPRMLLTLDIDDPSHEAAAIAVIGSMYGVSSALQELQQPELVVAAIIADRLQVAGAVKQAVELLDTAVADSGLADATVAALGDVSAMPSCLLPTVTLAIQHYKWCNHMEQPISQMQSVTNMEGSKTMEKMLLTTFGDLEAVFKDAKLQSMLFNLPAPALQLLLSSDNLIVASEDTAFYAVETYARSNNLADEDAAKLAELVRCPHLSDFCLTALATTADHNKHLLTRLYGSSLKVLPNIVRMSTDAAREHFVACNYYMEEAIKTAPPSWRLGPRQLKNGTGVQIVWEVPVDRIKEACLRSSASKGSAYLHSPTCGPLAGMDWQAHLKADWQEKGIGSKLVLYVGAAGVLVEGCYMFKFTMEGPTTKRTSDSKPISTATRWGFADFFGLGVMAGGWDEAAWASKGLPVTGNLHLIITVHKVY